MRSVDAAQRLAARLDNNQLDPGNRLPKPGEYGRLPGTGNRGGDRFTYVTVIEIRTPQLGVRDSFTHVVESDVPLDGAEVRARAMTAAQTGNVVGRLNYPARMPAVKVQMDVRIVSAYRGSLDHG